MKQLPFMYFLVAAGLLAPLHIEHTTPLLHGARVIARVSSASTNGQAAQPQNASSLAVTCPVSLVVQDVAGRPSRNPRLSQSRGSGN